MTGSPVYISKIDTLKMKKHNQVALPRLVMQYNTIIINLKNQKNYTSQILTMI